jgi:hypothetical protein
METFNPKILHTQTSSEDAHKLLQNYRVNSVFAYASQNYNSRNMTFSKPNLPLKATQTLEEDKTQKKVIRKSIPNSLKNYFEPTRNVIPQQKTYVLKPSQVKIKIVKMPPSNLTLEEI